MDEPLGTLDAAFRELMCEELRGLHNRIGATTVYVTHDQIEAMAMADRHCGDEQGRRAAGGPAVRDLPSPAQHVRRQFIGSPAMNFLDCAGRVGPGAEAVAFCGQRVPMPPLRAGAVRSVWSWACGRSMSASMTPPSGARCSGSSTWEHARLSRSSPRPVGSACAPPTAISPPSASMSASRSIRASHPVRPRKRAGIALGRCCAGGRPWLRSVSKGSPSVRRHRGRRPSRLDDRRRRVHGAARPHRCRQDHDPAAGGRP